MEIHRQQPEHNGSYQQQRLNNLNRLMSYKEISALFGVSARTLGRQIENELLTEPISIGTRKLIPANEVEELLNARIKGFNDIELQALVINLMHKRKEA
ncbi:hypothetical protein I3260_18725 [Photobacterium damselae]|uniref:helix-turn-helix transcriptional regulator n=2 Tax=Gammaproteobacteria TaxID=1236 RepID=UPI001EDE5E3A|nr:helix-turn-helix domain-containing protein [Photobacterium damselae]MCG3814272.1 hypothetical protein [Photobacterium damselae]